MASGNGDIGGLGDESILTPGSSSPTETTNGADKGTGNAIDAAAGGDASNTTTTLDESAEPLKIPAEQRSADYQILIQYGLDEKVSAKLDDIYNTGEFLSFTKPIKSVC